MNPYDVLGVAPDCDNETLKAGYRRLVRDNHPDLAGDETQRSARTTRMTQLNEAWLLIGDPTRRAAFDARRRLDEFERLATAKPKPAPRVKVATSNYAANARRADKLERNVFKMRPVSGTAGKKDDKPGKRREAKVSNSQLVQVHLANAIRLFYTDEKPQEAAALCQRVLRLDFRNVTARELLSEIYMKQGDWQRARELLRQAVDLQPDNLALRRKLKTLGVSSERGKAQNVEPNRPVAVSKVSPSVPSHPKPERKNASLWQRLRSRLKAR